MVFCSRRLRSLTVISPFGCPRPCDRRDELDRPEPRDDVVRPLRPLRIDLPPLRLLLAPLRLL
jgi:hypothetical protein